MTQHSPWWCFTKEYNVQSHQVSCPMVLWLQECPFVTKSFTRNGISWWCLHPSVSFLPTAPLSVLYSLLNLLLRDNSTPTTSPNWNIKCGRFTASEIKITLLFPRSYCPLEIPGRREFQVTFRLVSVQLVPVWMDRMPLVGALTVALVHFIEILSGTPLFRCFFLDSVLSFFHYLWSSNFNWELKGK